VEVILGLERLYCLTSVGHNHIFVSQYLTVVETFIFDYSRDFYGETLELDFKARLRGMIRRQFRRKG
jgi:FAD synthase